MTALNVIVMDNHLPFSNFNTSTNKYEGFYVEVWEKIAKKLGIQYTYFKSDPNDETEDIITKINAGKYDIGVGKFSITKQNIDLVDFSRPIKISSYYIFKLNNNTFFQNFFSKTFYSALLLSFILFVILFLMYWFFSKLSFFSSLYLFYLLFLNRGINVLEYQNYTSIKIINIVTILFSFIFLNFIIYNIVHSVVNKEKNISNAELKSIKTLYEIRHSAIAYLASELEYKIIPVKNFDELELKMQTHNGYSLLDVDYLNYHLPNSAYVKSFHSILKDENAFPINKQHQDILRQINESIVEFQDTKTIQEICKKYRFDVNSCSL